MVERKFARMRRFFASLRMTAHNILASRFRRRYIAVSLTRGERVQGYQPYLSEWEEPWEYKSFT